MISEEDSFNTFEYPDHYKILPSINNWSTSIERIKDGKKVPDSFSYTSLNNSKWMSAKDLQGWIAAHEKKLGLFKS